MQWIAILILGILWACVAIFEFAIWYLALLAMGNANRSPSEKLKLVPLDVTLKLAFKSSIWPLLYLWAVLLDIFDGFYDVIECRECRVHRDRYNLPYCPTHSKSKSK